MPLARGVWRGLCGVRFHLVPDNSVDCRSLQSGFEPQSQVMVALHLPSYAGHLHVRAFCADFVVFNSTSFPTIQSTVDLFPAWVEGPL